MSAGQGATTAGPVIESVELPDYGGWFLGVQWHPEDTWEDDTRQLAMVQAFVEAAHES